MGIFSKIRLHILDFFHRLFGKGRSAKKRHRRYKAKKVKRRPKRCCGSYIPDCEGCPFFQRPLFGEPQAKGRKGRCLFYKRDLKVESTGKRSRVILEVDEDKEGDEEVGK